MLWLSVNGVYERSMLAGLRAGDKKTGRNCRADMAVPNKKD